MRYGPPFRYAYREDGRRVAYQVVGDGDLDLVFLFGWPTHLGLMWENPSCASFLRGLSSFSRLLLYDRVGAACRTGGRPGTCSRTRDRKSTRLNSSHTVISYAVFCLKKKKQKNFENQTRNIEHLLHNI